MRVAEFFLPRAQRAEERLLPRTSTSDDLCVKSLESESTVTAFEKFTHVSFQCNGKHFSKPERGTCQAMRTVLWPVSFKCALGNELAVFSKCYERLLLFLFLICSHFCEIPFSVKSQQSQCNKEGSNKSKLMFHSAKYSEILFSRVLPGNLRQSANKLIKLLL